MVGFAASGQFSQPPLRVAERGRELRQIAGGVVGKRYEDTMVSR